MNTRLGWLVTSSALLVLAVTSWGATLNVPAGFATIQAAIDAAAAGDTIVVAPGLYQENLDCTKGITIRSVNPLDPGVVSATVIDGQRLRTAVILGAVTGIAALQGFTIVNGFAPGPGAAKDGGGVRVAEGTAATIEHNLIVGNFALLGGGISSDFDCTLVVRRNTISGNSSANGGGMIVRSGPSALIEGNRIGANVATGVGGGAFIFFGSPIIRGNVISGNQCSARGGGLALEAGAATIVNNVISGNRAGTPTIAGGGGGGISLLSNCTPTIRNNTIVGNTAAPTTGAGIDCLLETTVPTIVSNIIASNVGGTGVAARSGALPAVSFCNVFGNPAGDFSGFTPSGPGNLSLDPLFANAAANDFHLRSRGGRFDPLTRAFVVDGQHSPCIDAGDPATAFASELAPNGGRVNMGAYGNTVEASKSFACQPDLHIKNSGDPAFVGNNIINTTGAGQSKAQTVATGVKAIYIFRLQNDGPVFSGFRLTCPGGNPSFSVAYFDAVTGGTNVTSKVTVAGGWVTPVLGPAAFLDFRVEVSPLAVAVGGTVKDMTITARSMVNTTLADVVKATTTAVLVRKPDAMTRKSGEAASAFLTNNAYNATGAGQNKAQSVGVGVAAVYHLRCQNDGNASDTFSVVGPGSGAGWTIRYFNAFTGGTEITAQVTGTGFLTPVVARGANSDMRVEVRPDSTVPLASTQAVLVTMRSAADLTKLDAVRSVTTRN